MSTSSAGGAGSSSKGAGSGGASGGDVGRPEPLDVRRWIRTAIWVVTAALATLFLVGNNAEVSVNLIFATATMPLYGALLIAMGLGVIIGAGLAWGRGRRKAKMVAAAKG